MLAAARVRSERKNISEKKNMKNRASPKTHNESHSSPATATTSSRRHVMKHVPRVRPHSPASIDAEFVEIDLVQLSQSEKTTNVTHVHTDKLNNGTLYAPRYGEAFFPNDKKTVSVSSLPRPCLVTSGEVH